MKYSGWSFQICLPQITHVSLALSLLKHLEKTVDVSVTHTFFLGPEPEVFLVFHHHVTKSTPFGRR